MSRIRADNITNRMANGAPTAPNGLVVSGVTTVTTLDLNGDLDVDGHLNADNVSIAGVATATTLSATTGTFGDFVDVGSNIKLGNAGVITATSFSGSGANLTGIDATAIKDSGGNVKIQAQASGAVYTGIHTFGSRMTVPVASSNPSGAVAGDLYFNTTSNELRVYNGSTWQGGVTATGNLAGLGSNTFSGNQTINANIIVSGTVDGVDIATRDTLFGGLTSSSGVLSNGVTASTQSAADNSTKVATTAYVTTAIGNINIVVDSSPQLGGDLDGQYNDLTNIGTIDAANLQIDFGTI